jgi:hypothetical protein
LGLFGDNELFVWIASLETKFCFEVRTTDSASWFFQYPIIHRFVYFIFKHFFGVIAWFVSICYSVGFIVWFFYSCPCFHSYQTKGIDPTIITKHATNNLSNFSIQSPCYYLHNKKPNIMQCRCIIRSLTDSLNMQFFENWMHPFIHEWSYFLFNK